ncbi:unnamed protein product [Bursaphelenchus xylophilus]|uniref:(pine wood nematode) hypothetical protein n=1 Tax=Bursaphelenchus xylophilus TaxID=6326 RepID=A0A1I7S643_BURXY|nr:unnamed protein product [Bursaphelenchus xylophilus]CAG9082284.1 unnamed protein product [Bursaphelenchus xylophilus]
MVWSLTNIVFFLMLIATYEVEIITVYAGVITRGVVEYFQIPQLSPILQTASFSLFDMHVVITLCRFLFRYAQSTEKRRLLFIMSHKHFFAFLFFLYIVILLVTIYLRRNILQNGIEFQRQFPSEFVEQKKYIMSHVVTVSDGFSINNFFEFIAYPITLVAGGFCTYKCYAFQRRAKSKFSERTQSMYKLLIYGLIIEQAGELVCFVIPFILVGILLPPAKQSIGFYVVHRIFYIYPTFVMIFTLTFYRRFRDGVKQMFGRIYGNIGIPSLGPLNTTGRSSTLASNLSIV